MLTRIHRSRIQVEAVREEEEAVRARKRVKQAVPNLICVAATSGKEKADNNIIVRGCFSFSGSSLAFCSA
jgi:hypothetical protein